MEGERMEDDDRDAIPSLSSVPPPRKIHSYSQHLRTPSSSHKKRHQIRKHSLDDDRIPSSIDQFYTNRSFSNDDDPDDFFPYSSTASARGDDFDYGFHKAAAGDAPAREDLHPMPEFVASGGGAGIFRVPPRSAVHPSWPPCLELRPHPLKETQEGKFLRNIACTDTQLWAGQESGVRVWDLTKVSEIGSRLEGRIRRGDEDFALFRELVTTSPTMCLIVDSGNRLVWIGHKDGKIISWKMDQPFEQDAPFKEGLSWQAHHGPVPSMVMTSYGKRECCEACNGRID